jgi:hypothetical protein
MESEAAWSSSPGAESLFGRLWAILTVVAVGNALLVLPLLWEVVTQPASWNALPEWRTWWTPLMLAGAGLIPLVVGLNLLVGLLLRSARAAARGLDGWALARLVTDSGDLGRLLAAVKGGGPVARVTTVVMRSAAVGAFLYLVAALWPLIGLALGVAAARAGRIGPSGLLALVIGPTLVLVTVGLAARTVAGLLAHGLQARRAPGSREDLGGGELQAVSGAASGRGRATRKVPLVLGLRATALAVIVAASWGILAAVRLSLTAAGGPVLVSLATPRFDAVSLRAAAADALEEYRPPPDATITPEAAGAALHRLLITGEDRGSDELVSLDARAGWLDGLARPDTVRSESAWALDLLERAAAGKLTQDELRDLVKLARHPGHADFALVAQASAADIVGTRYRLPFAEDATWWSVTIPRYSQLTTGANAHIALAGWHLHQGRTAQAEMMLREVIAVGLALVRDGPTIIDNLIGLVMAERGGRALEVLLRATGREVEADRFELVRTTLANVRKRSALGASAFPQMAEITLDEGQLRGVRWESFVQTAALGGCINLHGAVFGTHGDYEEWLRRAERSLVRYPGEGALFEVAKRPWSGMDRSVCEVGLVWWFSIHRHLRALGIPGP